MTMALDAPLSVAEFSSALQRTSNNVAPGVSRVTFRMLKSWPPAVTALAVEALSRLWQTKTTPESWTTRWIMLKVKDPSKPYTPANMRPLTLIESLRKLWERILLNRMHSVWDQHQVLSPLQHSGRRKGTAAPFLNSSTPLSRTRKANAHYSSCRGIFERRSTQYPSRCYPQPGQGSAYPRQLPTGSPT
jgi:hypothetical protein